MKTFSVAISVLSAFSAVALAEAGTTVPSASHASDACSIVGNTKTKTYHQKGDAFHSKEVKDGKAIGANATCFNSVAEAVKEGYQAASGKTAKIHKK
jgi:hypothetical protein